MEIVPQYLLESTQGPSRPSPAAPGGADAAPVLLLRRDNRVVEIAIEPIELK